MHQATTTDHPNLRQRLISSTVATLSFACLSTISLAMQSAYANEEMELVDEPPHEAVALIDIVESLAIADNEGAESLGALSSFYEHRNYAPAWVTEEGPTANGQALLAALRSADSHGLNPAIYRLAEIEQLATATATDDLAKLDRMLSAAFIQYGGDLMQGRYRQGEAAGSVQSYSTDLDLLQPLRFAAQSGAIDEVLHAFTPPQEQYHRIVEALSRYRAIANAGGWPLVDISGSLEPGDWSDAVATLRERLRVSGDYSVNVDQVADASFYDQTLADAVRLFQERHGLLVDAVVGPRTLGELNTTVEMRIAQLEIALERWRWLPRDLGQRYVMVNVPAFHLTAVDDTRGEPLTMRVIVGTREHQTPVFNDTIEYVQMNPYWNVPYSIATEEYLPQLIRDPFYLLNRNIRIFSGSGEVNPVLVDWAAYGGGGFPYHLRQDPGAGNALGDIKFMFPNGHAVYLHDTPTQPLFNRTTRAFSHGCVRVHDPIALAEFVLGVDPSYTRERITSMIGSERTIDVNLPEEIPVYITYQTAWVDDHGSVHFRQDIYDRDSRLLAKMMDDIPEAGDAQMAAN